MDSLTEGEPRDVHESDNGGDSTGDGFNMLT